LYYKTIVILINSQSFTESSCLNLTYSIISSAWVLSLYIEHLLSCWLPTVTMETVRLFSSYKGD